jgi:hypothetical protein
MRRPCRWDDPNGEYFNVEANSTGVGVENDDYYRLPGFTPLMEKEGLFLRSKTPRQELSNFLTERAFLWRDGGSLRACVDSLAWAAAAAPEWRVPMNTLVGWYNKWLDEVNGRKPPSFPTIRLRILKRRYPDTLPVRHEFNILCIQTIDSLLRDPEAEQRWWAALREGRLGARTPSDVYATAQGDQIGVSFRYAGN